MNQDYTITKEDIWQATENGKAVIIDIYPQSEACFASGGRKGFKIRPDDKNPSCAVFTNKEGIWMVQDKGGSDNQARTAIQLVMKEYNLTFGQAMTWIAEHYAPQLLDQRKDYRPVKPEATKEFVAAQDEANEVARLILLYEDREMYPEVCDEKGL